MRGLVFAVSILALFFAARRTSAQAGPSSGFTLGPLVVTATRSLTEKEYLAANLITVDREEASRFPVENVAEALRYQPGLHMHFNGGLGSLATLAINGSETRQVAVYMDGVRLNQLANPIADLSQIPWNQVERIEVLKGAGSSAWGSALGGVVNIITREPDPEEGPVPELHIALGEHDTRIGQATVSGSPSPWGYLFSADRLRTDGFVDHGASEHGDIYFKLRRQLLETMEVTLTANYLDGSFENPLATLPLYWEKNVSRRFYQTLQAAGTPMEGLGLYVSAWNQRFTNYSDTHYTDGSPTIKRYHYVEKSRGTNFRTTYELGRLSTTTLGLDAEWNCYSYSNNPGDQDGSNLAVYLNEVYNLGPLSLNAGVRYDNNSDFGNYWSPSGGAVLRVGPWNTRIRFQAAAGFNAPPVLWLHDPKYGNPDLQAERGIDLELALETSPWSRFSFSISGFWADLDDLILFNRMHERYENIREVRRRGVAGLVRGKLALGFEASFGFTLVDAENAETGETLKDIPRTIWDLQLSHVWKGLFQSLTGRWADTNSSSPESRDKRFVFDYHIRYQIPPSDTLGEFQLFASVINLFNTTYYYSPAFPQPDRTVRGGLSWKF